LSSSTQYDPRIVFRQTSGQKRISLLVSRRHRATTVAPPRTPDTAAWLAGGVRPGMTVGSSESRHDETHTHTHTEATRSTEQSNAFCPISASHQQQRRQQHCVSDGSRRRKQRTLQMPYNHAHAHSCDQTLKTSLPTPSDSEEHTPPDMATYFFLSTEGAVFTPCRDALCPDFLTSRHTRARKSLCSQMKVKWFVSCPVNEPCHCVLATEASV